MANHNPFEELNRERKIVQILSVIDRYAHETGVSVYKHARALATAAENAPDVWWRSVASAAGCTPPSDETKAGVVRLIRQRADILKLPVASTRRVQLPGIKKPR